MIARGSGGQRMSLCSSASESRKRPGLCSSASESRQRMRLWPSASQSERRMSLYSSAFWRFHAGTVFIGPLGGECIRRIFFRVKNGPRISGRYWALSFTFQKTGPPVAILGSFVRVPVASDSARPRPRSLSVAIPAPSSGMVVAWVVPKSGTVCGTTHSGRGGTLLPGTVARVVPVARWTVEQSAAAWCSFQRVRPSKAPGPEALRWVPGDEAAAGFKKQTPLPLWISKARRGTPPYTHTYSYLYVYLWRCL